jgi:hypothetical protein
LITYTINGEVTITNVLLIIGVSHMTRYIYVYIYVYDK